jgi:hypothetical protein
MQVLLDGHPLHIARQSLAGALQAAAANAQSQGRIIIEAKADGISLSDENLTDPSDEPSTIRELKFTSADPRRLASTSLTDASTALELARVQQASAAELIQAGQPEEALRSLHVALSTWQSVRDVVQSSATVLSLDLDTLVLSDSDDPKTFGDATRELSSHLANLKNSLEAMDWSATTDIVGYDLDAQVGTWKGLLTALANHVDEMPAPKGEAP